MAPRPGFNLDLREPSFQHPVRRGSPSPRRDFLSPAQAGDVPPPLSPLDAFALQGRILAQKLEESQQLDNRVSRLPANTIAQQLGRSRVNFFQVRLSPPAPGLIREAQRPSTADPSSTTEIRREIPVQDNRPRSHYPIIQTFDDAESIMSRDSSQWEDSPPVETVDAAREYLKAVEPVASRTMDDSSRGRSLSKSSGSSPAKHTLRQHQRRPSNIVIVSPRSNSGQGLDPLPSPGYMRSPTSQLTIRPVRKVSGDDVNAESLQGVLYDPQRYDRRPSASSNLSLPRSPFQPVFAPPRSPSMSSEYSVGRNNSETKYTNFSRPISRDGRLSCEPQPSAEMMNKSVLSGSPQVRPIWEKQTLDDRSDGPPSHRSPFPESPTSSLDPVEQLGQQRPRLPDSASSMTQIVLPRGRTLNKSSLGQSDSGALQSPEKLETDVGAGHVRQKLSQQSLGPKGLGLSNLNGSPKTPKGSHPDNIGHIRSRSADSSASAKLTPRHRATPSVPFVSTRGSPMPGMNSSPLSHISAMTPTLHHTPITREAGAPLLRGIDQFTPEEHLAKGISSHEQGALQKSTYHLRIAARAGLPTAMLLYALACRHGWGMRPNQAEGVVWLKKAVNSSGLEVAADENPPIALNPPAPFAPNDSAVSTGSTPLDRKAHQAQLALAIYELGVSYNNGWGISQSKPLALRCFEIAASWGDADAMAEAGFCYTKGVGCKKDLKKAADLYRRAESKGISMTGNSWIYKEKYLPNPEKGANGDDGTIGRSRSTKKKDKEKEKEKKPRDKSRTRTIFGRKKETVAASDV